MEFVITIDLSSGVAKGKCHKGTWNLPYSCEFLKDFNGKKAIAIISGDKAMAIYFPKALYTQKELTDMYMKWR